MEPPNPLPPLRCRLRSALLGSADSLGLCASGPSWGWWWWSWQCLPGRTMTWNSGGRVKSGRLCELPMSSSACLGYVNSAQHLSSAKRTKANNNKQQVGIWEQSKQTCLPRGAPWFCLLYGFLFKSLFVWSLSEEQFTLKDPTRCKILLGFLELRFPYSTIRSQFTEATQGVYAVIHDLSHADPTSVYFIFTI